MSTEQKLLHVALEAINALMMGAERYSDNHWGRICMPTDSAMSKGADAAMAIRQALATTEPTSKQSLQVEPAVNQQLTTELDEREAFEKWAAPNRFDVGHTGEDGSYLGRATSIAWAAWQARAAMAKGVKG